MYRANKGHLQPALISNVNDLPEKQRRRLERSWADTFYREFFSRIDEDAFAVLYADVPSRPNIPVNVLIGLEALKAGHGWSDEELYDAFTYNVQVRYALGYHQLGEGDFELRTLYNFRQRLAQYNLDRGVNLLEKVFKAVTGEQLAALQLRTGKQRMDSTQIASNIVSASRLHLLVEALQRVHRELNEVDRQRYAAQFEPYLAGSAGQYVYRVKGLEATQEHLREVGQVMHTLLPALRDAYGDEPAYQVLERIFADNFKVETEVIAPKANKELSAGSLQSVDDLEATFRRKRGREYKGYVANVTETCDDENPVQLITQVQVAPNNTDDAEMLCADLPDLKARTGVHTLYADGGYGSPDADATLIKQKVDLVQTAIRGSAPDPDKFSLSDHGIETADDGTPLRITCPQGQTVAIEAGHSTGYLARFDPAVCQTCPFADPGRCRAKPGKRDRRYTLSFTLQEVHWALRRQRSEFRKVEARNRRAAVEATVRSVKHPFPAGKLPVRGRFRVTCMVIASAAMVNIRRIQGYRQQQAEERRQKQALEGQDTAQSGQVVLFFASISARLARFLRSLTPYRTCFSC